jgi:hypothetical protein
MSDQEQQEDLSLRPSKLNKTDKRAKRSGIKLLSSFFKKYGLFKKCLFLIPSKFILWVALKLIFANQIKPPAFFLHPIFFKNLQKKHFTIWLHPNQIEWVLRDWVNMNQKDIHISDYFFGLGDWTNISYKSHQSSVEHELKELLLCDWDYQKTAIYQTYIKRMQEGQYKSRQHVILDTVEKIDGYFERFHALYLSIKTHGFLSTYALEKIKTLDVDREIGVAINEHGRLIKLPGGQHRFAIASALNLRVPVAVRLIHIDFIKQHNIKTPSELFDVIARYQYL